MGLVWGILFPLGAITIRYLNIVVSNPARKHQVIQVSSLIILLIAGGSVFYIGHGQFASFRVSSGEIPLMTDQIFGTVIIAMTAFQAGLGWYHHRRFLLGNPSNRPWFAHVHLWLGRVTILGGMTNCGFGLILAQVKLKWAIYWWIGCGMLTTIYVCALLVIRVTQNLAVKKIREKAVANASV